MSKKNNDWTQTDADRLSQIEKELEGLDGTSFESKQLLDGSFAEWEAKTTKLNSERDELQEKKRRSGGPYPREYDHPLEVRAREDSQREADAGMTKKDQILRRLGITEGELKEIIE